MTDQAGKVTTYGYDGARRLTSVQNALNQTTSYQYDGAGRVLQAVPAHANPLAPAVKNRPPPNNTVRAVCRGCRGTAVQLWPSLER